MSKAKDLRYQILSELGREGGLSRSKKKVDAAIENLKIARRFTPIAKTRPLDITAKQLKALRPRLTTMELTVLMLRVGKGAKSVIEVSSYLNVSRARVYKLQSSALTKLNGRS